MAEAGRKLSLSGWVWVSVAGLAAFELIAHPLIITHTPSDESWREAASFVRASLTPTDRIVSAPSWTDPFVRRELGDVMSLRAAAPPDDAGFDRIWELGIRGATTRTDTPTLERMIGPIRVRMWEVEAPAIVFDFVEHIAGAEVELVKSDVSVACPWTRGRPDPGGLERGPMKPVQRFECDSRRPWAWVGATILADLDLRPRRCIWQHPSGDGPVRTTFRDVPLADTLVVRAGVDYQVERRRKHAPVILRVFIDDVLAGELVHRDGDGWTGFEIDTTQTRGASAAVRFETTASDPTARLFCYAASTQAEGAP